MSVELYRSFIGALNEQDLPRAESLVQRDRYQENCIGFTPGFVAWPAAAASLAKVWQGLPDLRVDLVDVAAAGSVVLARGTVTGTNTGRLYGVPATGRSYRVAFFDSCEFDQELIVRRVQQADVLSQMRQLYGRVIGVAGVASSLVRVDPTATL